MQDSGLLPHQLPFDSLVFTEYIGGQLHGQVFLGSLDGSQVIITRLNPFFVTPALGSNVSLAIPFPEIELFLYVPNPALIYPFRFLSFI